MPYRYPEKISPHTKFALYAGLPLTRTGDECIAWDSQSGRPFDTELFDAYAKSCTEEDFRRAVEAFRLREYRVSMSKGVPIILPRKFPEGTRFADDEGTPLTLFEGECTAWDRPGGRLYNDAVFTHRAHKFDEAKFRSLVDEVNVGRLAENNRD